MFEFFNEEVSIIPKKILSDYKNLGISSESFILLLYFIVHREKLGCEANIKEVAEQLGWKESECYDYLSELLLKSYIRFDMVKDENGRQRDVINVEPIFKFLYPEDKKVIEVSDNLDQMKASSHLVEVFEGEFGRSLTQLELMQINAWKNEDLFNDELIMLALQQAVLNQALSLKYIDRILLEWKKKNIQTLEEAKREINRFNEAKINHEIRKSTQIEYEPFSFPEIDWENL